MGRRLMAGEMSDLTEPGQKATSAPTVRNILQYQTPDLVKYNAWVDVRDIYDLDPAEEVEFENLRKVEYTRKYRVVQRTVTEEVIAE